MALTITDAGNGTSTSSSSSLSTGSTVTASVGDMLLAVVAGDNNGTSGAVSLASVQDSGGNTWTQRALINQDPGSAAAGATLGIYTAAITSALSSGTVTANFSPNTAAKALQVYRVQPGAGELVQFIAADATGSTGSTTTHAAATVSVNNGDTIFGCAAVEQDAVGVTGDSDTTNGNWSSIISRIANTGSGSSSMLSASQYKTVNATGNQAWSCTTPSAADSARSYLILRAANANVSMPAAQGSHSLTGQAATLTRLRGIRAEQGAYVLTGRAATLKAAKRIAAVQGAYALTGFDATFKTGIILSADDGSIAVTGQAAGLVVTRRLAASHGAYDLLGQELAFLKGFRLTAEQGSFTLTGQSAGLGRVFILAANQGAFVLSGTAARLLKAKRIIAAKGDVTIDGFDVEFFRGKVLIAAPGAIVLNGQGAILDLRTFARPPRLSGSIGRAATLKSSIARVVRLT